MTERRPCPSDLSDARWALIEPVPATWRAERRVPPGQRCPLGHALPQRNKADPCVRGLAPPVLVRCGVPGVEFADDSSLSAKW